jgi:hypothetical protein
MARFMSDARKRFSRGTSGYGTLADVLPLDHAIKTAIAAEIEPAFSAPKYPLPTPSAKVDELKHSC